tara:strand:+ start:29 stop:874 length:846 start_codon:yes stop_codon:yes gene_type:complete
MGNSVATIVTNQVIEGLKGGRIPWHKEWEEGATTPHNFTSGHAYRGVNVLLAREYCQRHQWQHPLFASYKQIATAGGQVTKGSKGNIITYWRTGELETEDENGQISTKKTFVLRYYNVFNIGQTDMQADDYIKTFAHESDTTAEELLHRHQPTIQSLTSANPCYRPSEDVMELPGLDLYKQQSDYYSVAFHELTHWSGHQSRLNRLLSSLEGNKQSYSKEELIAEMGANMLSFECKLETAVPDNSIAYIQNWLKSLQDNPNMVIQASSKAQQAFDYLIQPA